MQSAETVLDVLRERGRRGLLCDELYRQLFNPQFYLLTYGRLYSNKGAMTPGVDAETADGMSLEKIGRIIDALRHERYRFKPVKRIYIPEKNGTRRPLGLPRRAGFFPRSCLTSTCIGWTCSSRRFCYRNTTEAHAEDTILRTTGVQGALPRARGRGDRAAVWALRKQLRNLPTQDPQDPDYRRLRYLRYADDTLLGFAGTKAEAEQIKARLGRFVRDDLKLELSEEKTLVTHARTGAARFLGYEVTVQHSNRKIIGGRRAVNGSIGLRVPRSVITAKCARYLQRGKPASRSQLMNTDDHDIIGIFGAEYRGVVQYYLLAGGVARLSRLHWVMVTSLLKTLAGKYDSSVSKMARKYQATIVTPFGPRKCMQVSVERGEGRKPLVARFGGIPLRRQKYAVPVDRDPVRPTVGTKELINRLRGRRCEMCGRAATVEVHQIRKLADLENPGQPETPPWMALMARLRRKTLVVCRPCHDTIHRRPTAPLTQ